MEWGNEGQAALTAPIVVNPNFVPSGAETVLQIEAAGAQFVDGQVSVGIGSTDVAVRRVWVVSPTRLLVSVAVSPSASGSVLPVTILSGLQILNSPFAFSIGGPQPRAFWLNSHYANASTGGTTVSAGSQVVIKVATSPVALNQGNVSVVLNETRIVPQSVSGGQITFTVPAGTPQGLSLLRIEAVGERSLPIAIQVDAQSARILSITGLGPEPRPGELIMILVAGLGSQAENAAISVGGRDARVQNLIPADGDRYTVVVRVPEETLRGATVPVLVHLADAPSEPYQLKIGI